MHDFSSQAALKQTKDALEQKLKEQAYRIAISDELLVALKQKLVARSADSDDALVTAPLPRLSVRRAERASFVD